MTSSNRRRLKNSTLLEEIHLAKEEKEEKEEKEAMIALMGLVLEKVKLIMKSYLI
jgi:hypothetical protein